MSSNSNIIEDLKRRLMDSWSLNDEEVNHQDSAATYLDMGETEISPLPTRGKSRSPGSYNKSPTSQNIYDYTEYEGNDAFKSSERDHLSSLAINLSHQMEYNNTLLQQVETLESNQVETKEKFQFFETDIIQLRSALRIRYVNIIMYLHISTYTFLYIYIYIYVYICLYMYMFRYIRTDVLMFI
jgi:hypothetical protein